MAVIFYKCVCSANIRQEAEILSRNCPFRGKFVYVKTHKTGSTTLGVTLAVYLYKNGKYPAFGRNGVLGLPRDFYDPLTVLIGPNPLQFDAAISHIIWTKRSAETMVSIFGERPTVFTILRDPFTRFLSACSYFGIKEISEKYDLPSDTVTENWIISLLDQLEKEKKKTMIKGKRSMRHDTKTGLQNEGIPVVTTAANLTKDRSQFTVDVLNRRYFNVYSFDLGILSSDGSLLDGNEFDHGLQELDDRLDFVLINEEWALSMAVLKRFLCLSFEDVLWKSQKVRSSSMRNTDSFSNSTKEHFRRVFWRDYTIYEKYYTRFADNIMTIDAIRHDARDISQLQHQYNIRCLRSACTHDTSTTEIMNKLLEKKVKDNLLES
eukprot:gene7238-9694_t